MPAGRWLPTATTRNLPCGELRWQYSGGPMKTWVGIVDGKVMAVLRYRGTSPHRAWNARLDGWLWAVGPGDPSARFGLTETPVKAFPDIKKAKRAVEQAWSTNPHKQENQ